MIVRVGLCLLLSLAWACQVDLVTDETFDCTGDRQCAENFSCHVGKCVEGPILDAAPPEPEPEPEPDGALDAGAYDAALVDADRPDDDRDGDGVVNDDDNCPSIANDQVDADSDGIGDACDDDRDGDGVNNVNDQCPDVADPNQEDRNSNEIGDACEVPCAQAGAPCLLSKNRCSVEACGAEYSAFQYFGECDGRWCGDFDAVATQLADSRCGERALCQPDAEMPCAEVEMCPSDADCRPEADGAACTLVAEPGRGARCVDGTCRAWDCVSPACNEFGARRFSLNHGLSTTPLVLGQPGARVVQPGTQLHWVFPGRNREMNAPPDAQQRSLIDAHRYCTTLVFDDYADWRLPTLHELYMIATFSNDPILGILQGLIRARGLFYSRTVVGDDQVMAVALIDAVASPIPIDGYEAQVACVRSEEPAVRDLTLRRAAFTDWRDLGDVRDPYTDLLWTHLPRQMTYQEAHDECQALGRLPSLRELTTLLTFNTDPALIGPGAWLNWDGVNTQRSDLRAWSFAASPIANEHLHLAFATGQVTAALDTSLLDVLCVTVPVAP